MTSIAGLPSHGRGSAAEQGARIRAQNEERRLSQMMNSSNSGRKVNGKGWGMSQEEEKRTLEKEATRRREKEEKRKSAILDRQKAKEEAQEKKRVEKQVAESREEEARKEEEYNKENAAGESIENEGNDEFQEAPTTIVEKDEATAMGQHQQQPAMATEDKKALSKDAEKAAAATAVGGAGAVGAGAVGAGAVGAGAVGAGAVGAGAAINLEKKGRCYPVSGIDNLALLMEGDSYQTTCFSVYMFRSELDSETVHKFFDKLTASYPKYRYVVELSPAEASKKENARKAAAKKGNTIEKKEATSQEKAGRRTKYSKTLKAGGFFRTARWRYDETFHFQDNITELEGCPNGGKDDKALFDLAGEFLGKHFDYSKPLWQAMCVRGLDTSEGAKSALMIKVHHALSDGQGMIMSYHTALAALEHDAPIEHVQAQADSRSKSGEQKKPGQRNVHPTIWGTTKHGFHTIRGLYTGRRKVFEYQTSDRPSGRFYCHSDGIPMADIKLVRDVYSDAGLKLSLNDVACAVLSRALRMAAERTSTSKVTDKRVAIFVPISLRPQNNWELANYTTGGIAWFRFHDPKKVPFKEQLAQVNREMNRIKRSYWPRVWFSMFGSFAKRRAVFVPNYPIGKQFFEATYREYHVATNLPGPAKAVKFGKHEAFSYHVLPPSSPGKSTLSIGMISYANDFSLAVSCDGVQEFKNNKLAQVICQSFQDAAIELVDSAKEEAKKAATTTEKEK